MTPPAGLELDLRVLPGGSLLLLARVITYVDPAAERPLLTQWPISQELKQEIAFQLTAMHIVLRRTQMAFLGRPLLGEQGLLLPRSQALASVPYQPLFFCGVPGVTVSSSLMTIVVARGRSWVSESLSVSERGVMKAAIPVAPERSLSSRLPVFHAGDASESLSGEVTGLSFEGVTAWSRSSPLRCLFDF